MDEKPFGLQIHEEMRKRGAAVILRQRMRYADIQKVKAADREEFIRLLRDRSAETAERIRKDPPGEIAVYLIRKYIAMPWVREHQAAAFFLVFASMFTAMRIVMDVFELVERGDLVDPLCYIYSAAIAAAVLMGYRIRLKRMEAGRI